MLKNKNTFIYGFGPFAHYTHNVTMDVIAELEKTELAQCLIFDTQFSRKMFADALKQYQPSLIIGLGQDSRARKIRIERRARNWQQDLVGAGRAIIENDPDYRYVSLKVNCDTVSTVTYDAGAYVCNYSMYLMCDYAEKSNAKYAFLHFPINIDVNLAADFVANIIQEAVNAD